MPQLRKRFFGEKDMFILFADYAYIDIRPDGYDTRETICPLGVNERFVYFPYNNIMLEINIHTGYYNKFPCSDVKAAMLEAAEENKQILNGYKTHSGLDANTAMTKFLGNWLRYAKAVSDNDAYIKNNAIGILYDIISKGEFVKGYRLDTTGRYAVIRDFSAQARMINLENYLENLDNLQKAEPAKTENKEEAPSLSFVEAPVPEPEPEQKEPLLKKYVSGSFDCYCLLVDYDQMALPWPDGFETPEKRVEGQAPIGINDNYAFYCHNNEICYLYFGKCEQNKKAITNGAAFNRQLLDIAVENEKLENKYKVISNLVKLLENMMRIKHGTQPFSSDTQTNAEANVMAMVLFESVFQKIGGGKHEYSLDVMDSDTNCGNHFPGRFVMKKDGEPLTLEAALDSIIN